MSTISDKSIFYPSVAGGVTNQDFISCIYTDITSLQTFTNLATNNVCAYYSDQNIAQNLLLGGTNNVNIESGAATNVFSKTGFKLFHTDTINNTRYDSNLLNIDWSGAVGNFQTTFNTNNKLFFGFSNIVQFNSTFLHTGSNNTDRFSTNSTGGFAFDNPVSFSSNVNFSQNIITQGSIFGCNLNVWTTKTAELATDPYQIGYGFRVNSSNELELIKTATFGPNGVTGPPISKRIAVFGGHYNIKSTDTEDTSYLVFNNLNGLSVNNNGQMVQTTSSAATTLANMFTINGNSLGLGLQPSTTYKLDVNGAGHFSQYITADGGMFSGGDIQPVTTGTVSVGASDYMFKKVYAQSLYYSGVDFITKDTLGRATFSNVDGSVNSLVCKQVVFGDSTSSLVTLKSVDNSISFVDKDGNTLNAVGSTSSDPTQTSTGTIATIAAVNRVYSSNNTLSNYVYTGNWTKVQSISGNNLTITGSNATFSNISVAGADFAEYLYKSNPVDVYASGEIVGVDADGKLTKTFADAYHFMVVSTAPGLIAGASEENKDLQEMIGFCGRVAVNCPEAQVGHHIVPIVDPADNVSISHTSIADTEITFDQYRRSVGRVITLSPEPIIVLKSA